MSVNKAILIGNVGKDPEIRTTAENHRVAVLYLATSDRWRDKMKNTFKEKTEWHKIVVLSSGLVGIIEKYVRKGSKLYIEGMIQTRKWTDTNTNVEKTSTEIVLQGFNNKMAILDRAKKKDEDGNYDEYSEDGYNSGGDEESSFIGNSQSYHGDRESPSEEKQFDVPDEEVPF